MVSARRISCFAAAVLAACCAPLASENVPGEQTASDIQGRLFVANKRGNSLSMIDLASGREVKQVGTCANPHELAISSDGRHVALACYSGRTIAIYETADLDRLKDIELGEGARPHGIVWHANGAIVASAEGRGSIFVIGAPLEEDMGIREIGSGPPGPHMVVVDAAFAHAWGTIIPSGTVVRYDLATGSEAARVVLGGQTEAIALSPDGDTLWVGTNGTSKAVQLSVAGLETLHEVATGSVPIRLAMHPSGKWVVSSDLGSGSLSVIDTASKKVVHTIAVSGSQDTAQVTLVFSEDGERLYAAETGTSTVAEIDFARGRVIRRFAVGDGGDGLAVVTVPN